MTNENQPSKIKPSNPVLSPVRALKPKLSVLDGEVWTTSMAVAEHFGKRHDNVIRDILEIKGRLSANDHFLKFEEMIHHAEIGKGGVRAAAYFRLNKDAFSLLAMGFTGSKAFEWKVAYIKAFNYMAHSLLVRVPSRSAKDVLDEPRGDAMDSPLFNHVLRALDRKFGQAAVLTYLIENQGLTRSVSTTLRKMSADMDRTMSRIGISKVAAKLEERGVLDVFREPRGTTFSIVRETFAMLLTDNLIDVPAFLKLADEVSGSEALKWYEALPGHSKVLH